MRVLVRRGVTIAALSVWIGGIALYGAVVVPAGGKILGTTAQGFVTQRVTSELNLIAIVAIVALVWNTVVLPRHRIYLLVTTAQWLAAVVYGSFALAAWRDEDRRR